MAVTLKMIEEKEFKTKANGYDPDEVDDFLNDIMDEFEAMQKEIRTLRAAKDQAPAAAAAPAPQVRSAAEDSVGSAQKLLVNAQRVYDETVADAQKEAEKIVSGAKEQAEQIVRDAKNETSELQNTLETLRGAANDYRARFKRLIDDQMHVLNQESELFKS